MGRTYSFWPLSMTVEQVLLIALLFLLLTFLIWGRWRYDVVAVTALVIATASGLVPAERAFEGFGHPATITVALVLIIGRGLQNSGAVDLIGRHLLPPLKAPSAQVGVSAGLAGLLSTVMNNVAALSIMMPAVLQSAVRARHTPATVLMPLSFGSILGGLATVIGTPPNIIIAAVRADVTGRPFAMFDFTPVGGVVAVIGIGFVALVGWRLIPLVRRQRQTAEDLFEVDAYVGEMTVSKESKAVGMTLTELDDRLAADDAMVLEVIRSGQRIARRDRGTPVCAGDRVVVEAGVKAFDAIASDLNLAMAGSEKKQGLGRLLGLSDAAVMEAVVAPRSPLLGETKESVRFRRRYGVNLLAVSRRGQSFRGLLKTFRFRAGDVLLIEGEPEVLAATVGTIGCLPLSERAHFIRQPGQAVLSLVLFAAAIAAVAFQLIALPAALLCAACGFVLLSVVPPRQIYDSIDWPVVVLLGAMIPIGGALQSTGLTAVLAGMVIDLCSGLPPWTVVTVLLVVTMTLSDIINNAATAVVMAPVAVATAGALGGSVDPFLMAVAVGASCAFLTPIGHQNNTLVLGPGGYAFGDYWRVGFPLELLIVVVAVPMILWVWPM
jgi:di/tricarboxylate transporter